MYSWQLVQCAVQICRRKGRGRIFVRILWSVAFVIHHFVFRTDQQVVVPDGGSVEAAARVCCGSTHHARNQACSFIPRYFPFFCPPPPRGRFLASPRGQEKEMISSNMFCFNTFPSFRKLRLVRYGFPLTTSATSQW